MNIGNRYATWMHNTPATGYGNRPAQAGKSGRAFLDGMEENDNNVTNDAAGKAEAEEKGGEKKTDDMTYREQILAHMEKMAKKVKEGKVETINGRDIAIRADSVCVHGDNPKALEFVKNIREALTAEGIEVKNLR